MWKPLRNVAQFDNKSLEDVTICWKTITKPLGNYAHFNNKSLEDVTICWKTIKPPKMYNLLEQSQRY